MTTSADTQPRQHWALPHLDAAYNLARWMTGDDAEAEAVVRKSLAHRSLDADAGGVGSARVRLLQRVRTTCASRAKTFGLGNPSQTDETEGAYLRSATSDFGTSFAAAGCGSSSERINAVIARLPVLYREVLVLREMEDLPYRDIARIVEAPVFTTIARLSRARRLVREALHWPPALPDDASNMASIPSDQGLQCQ